MTKAEAYISDNPLWHLAHTCWKPKLEPESTQTYQERMYLHRDGHKLFCDNYYGNSFLVTNHDGREFPKVQIEHRYDDGTLDLLDAGLMTHPPRLNYSKNKLGGTRAEEPPMDF